MARPSIRPLGVEGVRMTPSIRGLIRDLAGLLRAIASRG